jgi:hypothetical protein
VNHLILIYFILFAFTLLWNIAIKIEMKIGKYGLSQQPFWTNFTCFRGYCEFIIWSMYSSTSCLIDSWHL